MILRGLDKHRDAGLLILRIGMGIMFMSHGFPKLAGGPQTWTMIGMAFSNFGITAFPVFWGFMAGLSEFGGGLFLAAGFFFRPACFMILCVMVTATQMHFAHGDSFGVASHAIEDGIVMLSLILIGPGKFALDEILTVGSGTKPSE